ncbi:ATP-binding protein [Agathobacter sp.]
MKFFYKMFLGMTAILAAALGVVEYATVSYTLEHAIQREQESALSQHQMVKYSIETVILNMNGDNVENELSDMMSQSAKSLVGDDGGIYLVDTDGAKTYIDACNCPVDDADISDGELTYSIVNDDNNKNTDPNSSDANANTNSNSNTDTNKYIHVISNFTLNDNKYTLLTEKNVTTVFDEAKELQRRCGIYYVVILGVGMTVILVLSWMITKPLASLTATTGKFARGDYKARSDVKTQDEIGELAAAFNDMAQNLENKIYELRMAAKKQEDFTANFAHELKTPMTSIIGYADTLYQKKMTPDEVHSAAGVILNEGMRLEALSFKLLELITLDKNDFQLEEAQIKEVIADCVDTAREAAKKHDTELICSANEAWVWLEYDLFKTMLLNLIDNAVKSGGNRVNVSGKFLKNVSDKTDTDDKAVSYRYYRVTVSDNGRGIPPEDMERITEAFYMVDKSRSRSEHGAGLGLALVSRIAELHHIQIHYESKAGEGTKVYFDMKAEVADEDRA